MGQYHTLYNLDKREFVHAHRIDNGLKLLEQVGHIASTSTALFLLIANSNARGGGDAPEHALIGRWAGDRILVQGDYANEKDQSFLSVEQIKEFEDISRDVKQMLDLVESMY